MRMEEDEKYQVEGPYTLEKGEFPEKGKVEIGMDRWRRDQRCKASV